MENNSHVKPRSGFPPRRQLSTEQPSTLKRASPSNPSQADPHAASPKNYSGAPQIGLSQSQAEDDTLPDHGARPNAIRLSSLQYPSKAGHHPVDRHLQPIKEEKDASHHKIKNDNTPFSMQDESKPNDDGHWARGRYPSRSLAPTPLPVGVPPDPGSSPRAITNGAPRYTSHDSRELPGRKTYGFGHIPAKRSHDPARDGNPNEVVGPDAEDNLVDPTKPVQITLFEPVNSRARTPGPRSHTPSAHGDRKGNREHEGHDFPRSSSDYDKRPFNNIHLLPPPAQGLPGGRAQPHTPQLSRGPFPPKGPVSEAFGGFPPRYDHPPSRIFYDGIVEGGNHFQPPHPSSLRRHIGQSAGSDPSILNSSMEEEMEFSYDRYGGGDAYAYAKPGSRGAGYDTPRRGPTIDQGALRFPMETPPVSTMVAGRHPHRQAIKSHISLGIIRESETRPKLELGNKRPLFARANGFTDPFDLVRQIDIAAMQARAEKFAMGFDDARTWKMSRDFVDNQMRLNEDLEMLFKAFHDKLNNLIQYKDDVLKNKVVRTGQYDKAVADFRKKADSLFEDTKRYTGSGNKRRRVDS